MGVVIYEMAATTTFLKYATVYVCNLAQITNVLLSGSYNWTRPELTLSHNHLILVDVKSLFCMEESKNAQEMTCSVISFYIFLLLFTVKWWIDLNILYLILSRYFIHLQIYNIFLQCELWIFVLQCELWCK